MSESVAKTPKNSVYLTYGALAGVVTGGLLGIVVGGQWTVFLGALIGVVVWMAAMAATRRERKGAVGK